MSTSASTEPDKQLPFPPGSTGFPLVGETLPFLINAPRFVEERRRRYGDVFHTHILGNKTVYFLGAEACRFLLMGEGKDVEAYWPETVQALLGSGAVTNLRGDEHRARRRLLAPKFSQTEMRVFLDTIEKIACKHLERAAKSPGPVVAVDCMRALAFEVAATLILGGEEADLPLLRDAFETLVLGLFTPLRWRAPFTPFGKAILARAKLDKHLDRIIAERQNAKSSRTDVLSVLLSVRDEDGAPMPTATIRDELVALLFAGHETTVNVMSNALLLLAQHPDVLAAGRREVQAVPKGEPLTIDTLRGLPFVTSILQETMRVLPPVAGVFRITLRDVEFGGYRIPKGTVVLGSIWGIHQDAKTYPEPEKFDPSRFDRDGERVRDHAFIPFGGGLRICIGQHLAMAEMQLVLTHLLRSYEWSLVPGQDLTYRRMPTPLPKSGGILVFRARNPD